MVIVSQYIYMKTSVSWGGGWRGGLEAAWFWATFVIDTGKTLATCMSPVCK